MNKRNRFLALLTCDPALLMGLVASGAYYAVMLQPAMQDTVLAHYTSEHAVEYVIVTLFFWGMFDITLKLLSFPREALASRHDWLPSRNGRDPVGKAREMLDEVLKSPGWLLRSCPGRRLVSALSFVVEKGTADDYREHLRHLADVDDQELHSKYTVVKFIVAVTPILGFLGTVVHFGGAIGGFSFDNMAAKLPEVVSGMGTAFNTTSVALATAMIMMFGSFLCERVDQGFVASTDRLVDRELLNRFEVKDPVIVPFLGVLEQAHRDALETMAKLLEGQVQIWAHHFEILAQKLDAQQQQSVAHGQEMLGILRERHEKYETSHEDRLRQLVAVMDIKQDKQSTQMMTVLERASAFRDDIGGLVQTLNAISRGEGRLNELQTTLATNLRVLHETGNLDSALHELTAAIHLLTSRNRELKSAA